MHYLSDPAMSERESLYISSASGDLKDPLEQPERSACATRIQVCPCQAREENDDLATMSLLLDIGQGPPVVPLRPVMLSLLTSNDAGESRGIRASTPIGAPPEKPKRAAAVVFGRVQVAE